MKKLIAILSVVVALGASSAFARGDAAAGRSDAGVCENCHGPDGASPTDVIPNLAGQGYAYLVEQLKAFRDGTRKNALMNAVAKALSDGQIDDLAAYFSSITAKAAASSLSPTPIPHPPIITSPDFVVPRSHPAMQFWADLMPKGQGRDLLTEDCQLCHDLQRAVAFSRSRDEWRRVVETMHERGSPITSTQIPVLVDYLTANFGLSSPPIVGPKWAVAQVGYKPCARNEWPKGSSSFRANWKAPYNIWVSNMQGGGIDIVDPQTLHIVDRIPCISAPDRVEFSRRGNTAYVPDRVEHNLTVIDTRTGAIEAKVPLIARPNTAVLTRDYKKLYMAIWPVRPDEKTRGYIQVVDTRTLKVIKTIVTKGAIHDTWMSKDGKLLLAMSPAADFMNVYDTRTDKLLYTCCTDAEIGTMVMEAGPDGSTSRFFIGYGGFPGIVAIDAKTGREVKRVRYPAIKGASDLPGTPGYFRGVSSSQTSEAVGFHGGEISPDGKNLWVISGSIVWRYELPSLKYLGNVQLAQVDAAGHAFTPKVEGTWLTISPDGRTVYAIRPGRDLMSVIDVKTMKEVAEVPTHQYPLHISIWPRGTP